MHHSTDGYPLIHKIENYSIHSFGGCEQHWTTPAKNTFTKYSQNTQAHIRIRTIEWIFLVMLASKVTTHASINITITIIIIHYQNSVDVSFVCMVMENRCQLFDCVDRTFACVCACELKAILVHLHLNIRTSRDNSVLWATYLEDNATDMVLSSFGL